MLRQPLDIVETASWRALMHTWAISLAVREIGLNVTSFCSPTPCVDGDA